MIRHRPTVAVVDLDAIRHNLAAVAPAGVEVMAVVKANAYGHGSLPVARAALEAGAAWLGVALVEEGVELREAGLTAPILVLTEFPPGSEKAALAADLTPSIYTEDGLHRLAEAAGATGKRVGVHLKVDTGMHRVGVLPEGAVALALAVQRAGLEVEAVWTHLAVADRPDHPATGLQLRRFREVVEALDAAEIRPRYLHAANSAAVLAHPEAHFDLVRVGIAMYGLSPGPALARATAALRPALSWRSAVALVKRVPAGEALSYGLTYTLPRPSTIATVPVGYADGYRRSLSGRASVLIRGRRYPVAGTVTMDQIMVDCGDDPVAPGDEVVLLGRQGQEEVTANEMAGWAGTINYEVVCGVSERVPRVYVGSR